MIAASAAHTQASASFAHVAQLGPYGEAAARELSAIYARLLKDQAEGDARSLLDLEDAAERRDFDALERLIEAAPELEELTERQHSRVRKVVGLRNLTALLPLMVTWLMLAWASKDYHEELTEFPKRSTESFLVLWQQHFGGRIIPSFEETALLSFGLLVAVLLLTWQAQSRENKSYLELAGLRSALGNAMNSLRLATLKTLRPPVTAEEWAEAAQRVLTETQDMIAAAVRDTRQLANTNNEISKSAETAMSRLRTQADEFMSELAREVSELMRAVRADSAKVVVQTADEAKKVLLQTGAANKQLVEQQMTPLFEGFRASLNDYRADQEVYRASANALVKGVSDLTESATVVAASSTSYTEIAKSIDERLGLIDASQTSFVQRITENSQSISTATRTMREVTDLMTGSMRTGIEALARNVVDASARLASVDQDLAATSTALADTTRAMRTATGSLDTAADSAARAGAIVGAGQRGLLRRLFGG